LLKSTTSNFINGFEAFFCSEESLLLLLKRQKTDMNTNVELRNNRVSVFVIRSYIKKLTPRKFNADSLQAVLFWNIPWRQIITYCGIQFFWKTIFNEFYTKLLPPGYDFFGCPGLFTRLFHNNELVVRTLWTAISGGSNLLTRKNFHGNYAYSRIFLHNETNNAFLIKRTNGCFY